VVLARMLQVHQRDQGGTGRGHGAGALPISSALGVSTSRCEGERSSCRNGCEGRWLMGDASCALRCCYWPWVCIGHQWHIGVRARG
jgi:hypothetical protein